MPHNGNLEAPNKARQQLQSLQQQCVADAVGFAVTYVLSTTTTWNGRGLRNLWTSEKYLSANLRVPM